MTNYRRGEPAPVAILAAILAKHPDAGPYQAAAYAAELTALANRMTGIAVRQCNGYRSETQERRDQLAWERYKTAAHEIARRYGCTIATQGDPRGAVLKLVYDDGREQGK